MPNTYNAWDILHVHNFLSSSFFMVIFLVQFCIIVVKNGLFYEKHKLSYLVTIYYYIIGIVYIYP